MTQSSAADFDIPGEVHNLYKKKKTASLTMRRVGSSIFCSSCLHHIFTGRNLINVSTIEPGFAPSGEEPLLLLGWTLLGSWTQTLSGPASTSVNTNTRLYCLLE